MIFIFSKCRLPIICISFPKVFFNSSGNNLVKNIIFCQYSYIVARTNIKFFVYFWRNFWNIRNYQEWHLIQRVCTTILTWNLSIPRGPTYAIIIILSIFSSKRLSYLISSSPSQSIKVWYRDTGGYHLIRASLSVKYEYKRHLWHMYFYLFSLNYFDENLHQNVLPK